MSRRQKAPLRTLSEAERISLSRLSRSQSAPTAQVARARALLAVAEGQSYTAAAQLVGFCQHSCQTRRREVKVEFSLRCFENSEHTAGTTQVKQATAAGGDVLVVAGGGGGGGGGGGVGFD